VYGFDIVHTFTNAAWVLCQVAWMLYLSKSLTVLSEHTALALFMVDAKRPGLRRALKQLIHTKLLIENNPGAEQSRQA
jgi:hypothetical protein